MAMGPAQKLLGRLRAKIFVPVILAWLVLLPFVPTYITAPAELRVFAAASLKDAMDHANARYQRVTGRKVVASYGGSDTLASFCRETRNSAGRWAFPRVSDICFA